MKLKVSFLLVFGLLFVFLMGCGGGTYGGNYTYLTITGSTWTKDTVTTPPTGDGVNLPTQLTFNNTGPNGFWTGSSSGGVGIYAVATFYWTYYGTTLSFYSSTTSTTPLFVLTAPLVGTVVSPMTLTTSTGGTATYDR
jgi:hypothetical protein